MTAENTEPRSPTMAIAIGASALIVLAMVTFMSIAMGGMMNGCAGCNGGMGAGQTPAVLTGDGTVTTKDFDYSPRDVTVPAGTTLTWINKDAAPHSATADDKAWETALLKQGESGSITFATPGVYTYYCLIHPYMKGKVTVQG